MASTSGSQATSAATNTVGAKLTDPQAQQAPGSSKEDKEDVDQSGMCTHTIGTITMGRGGPGGVTGWEQRTVSHPNDEPCPEW